MGNICGGDAPHRSDLMKGDFDDLKKFTFDGQLVQARVTDIYDGDTVTIVFYHGDDVVKYSFRMLGYDAPEIKPKKGTPNIDLHKQAAAVARDKLEERIESSSNMVWIKFTKEEKYGRLMGHMYLVRRWGKRKFNGSETCLNDWMVEEGYGKPYDGGKKQDFTKKDLQAIMDKQ
jgi:endonuclease YncB( thermonuclease family)